jgi:hypothetical protein
MIDNYITSINAKINLLFLSSAIFKYKAIDCSAMKTTSHMKVHDGKAGEALKLQKWSSTIYFL